MGGSDDDVVVVAVAAAAAAVGEPPFARGVVAGVNVSEAAGGRSSSSWRCRARGVVPLTTGDMLRPPPEDVFAGGISSSTVVVECSAAAIASSGSACRSASRRRGESIGRCAGDAERDFIAVAAGAGCFARRNESAVWSRGPAAAAALRGSIRGGSWRTSTPGSTVQLRCHAASRCFFGPRATTSRAWRRFPTASSSGTS
mmetsp:Transcript_25978/g.80259  ORF Transcript_25978/g.80259 Transcript_25978/m.80259 type:complete len:200 (+) Transcript_25978:631-1230(+)